MKQLSIFVDESGDFGPYAKHSPCYVITMVFHNQKDSIQEEVNRLDNELKMMNYNNPSIHTEPLIRKEGEYRNMSPNERRHIFYKLYNFANRCNIKYKSFIYSKKEFEDSFKLQGKMARDMSSFMKDNLAYFQSFDEIILYYDNGQHQITVLLNTLLAMIINNYVVRKVLPSDYKLFQVADMLCTLELLKYKIEHFELTRSEKLIFHSKAQLRKDFLKSIKKKEMK